MPNLVAIDLPGGPLFVDALRRAWDSGDAVLPVDQRLSPAAKRAMLEQLQPSVVETADGRSPQSGARPVQPGDALVVATSGTTGATKGVVLTHQAVAASAAATSSRLEVDPGRHRWLACLPLNHIGGLAVVTRSLLTGTPFTVLPRFDSESVLAHSGPDVLVSLVTTALRRIGSERFRTVLLGGSAPPPDRAANVVTTYGMTETGSGVVYDGLPLDGVEADIDGPGAEIRVKGPMLLRGYRDGTTPLDPDGWLATGDSGRWDAAGRLQIVGRLSDLIITGGVNVWPDPVESAIRAHPGVADVAVAGRPDPEWGERVVAWIVPADPSAPPALADVRALVSERIAAYAAPRQVVVVASLPRTTIGKVKRNQLPPPG